MTCMVAVMVAGAAWWLVLWRHACAAWQRTMLQLPVLWGCLRLHCNLWVATKGLQRCTVCVAISHHSKTRDATASIHQPTPILSRGGNQHTLSRLSGARDTRARSTKPQQQRSMDGQCSCGEEDELGQEELAERREQNIKALLSNECVRACP